MGTPPPTPQGILQKTSFFFLCALETSKIRHKLRNLRRPWGRAPTTYPPGTKALGPPPSPCTLPHRASFKKRHVSSFHKNDASCEICSAPGPVPLPPIFPAPKPLDPPPSPNLGPRGLGLPTHQPSPNPPPFSSSPYPRPPTPATKSPPGQLRWVNPPPQGIQQKTSFFLFFVRVKNVEICSVPGARAPTTYPPGTEALGPPPSPNLGPRGLGPNSLEQKFAPSVPLPPTPPEPKPLDLPPERL